MFLILFLTPLVSSAGYNLKNGESIEIRVQGEFLELDEIIFAANSKVTLICEGQSQPTVLVHDLGICGYAVLEGENVTVVFERIFSGDNDTHMFTVRGSLTVQTTADIQMSITNMILFEEGCVLDLAKYNNPQENVDLLVTTRSARVMNKWNVTNIELHGKKMRVVLSSEFLTADAIPILFNLIESVRPMTLFNNKSTVWTENDCELVFEGDMWTHRFKSCFALTVLGGYIAVRTKSLPYENLFVIGNESDIWGDAEVEDTSWVANLTGDVKRLSLVVAKNDVVVNLNDFVGSGLSVDIMAMPNSGVHTVRVIYEDGVTDEKIAELYFEGIDFYFMYGKTIAVPKFEKLSIGRGCHLQSYAKNELSFEKIKVIEYDVEVLGVCPEIMSWKNAVVVDVSPDIVRTDTKSFVFEFYSGEVVLNLGVDIVANPSFPFQSLVCPLYVDYDGSIGSQPVTLNVSRVIISSQFNTVNQLTPLTFIGKDLVIETQSSHLPFTFLNVKTLTINSDKDFVEVMGNVSVAAKSYFQIKRDLPTTVLFWETLALGEFVEAVLDNVWLHECLIMGRRSMVKFTASTVRCDIRFQADMDGKTPLIEVNKDTDFLPEAIYFDVSSAGYQGAGSVEASKLIAGNFDCEYVHARERYAYVDVDDGFYTFTGACVAEADKSESYWLKSQFVEQAGGDNLDYMTKVLISVTVSAVVIVSIIILVIFVVKRRKAAMMKANEHVMFE